MRDIFDSYAEKYGSVLTDIISSLLLCFTLSRILLPFISQEITREQCIAYCACAVLFCVVISNNKLTAPVLASLAALSALGFTVWQLKTGKAAGYILGFIDWCIGGLQETAPYSYDFSIHLIRFLIVLPIAALAYIFYRKLYSFIPIAAVSVLGIVYAQLNELEARYEIISLFLVLILTSMAQTTYRGVKKKLKDKAMMPEAVMRFAALMFSALIVFSSVSIARADDGKWKSKGLHRLISDMSDFIDYYIYGKGDSSGYDIGWSGYYPLGDRLGGNANTNNNVVIHVTADTPTLISGSIYNEYNGERWSDSETLGSFRLNSFFWKSIRKDAFALSNPRGGGKAKALYDEVTKRVKITISPDLLYRSIFTAGAAKSIEFKPYNKEVYFNKQGEVYLEKALSYGVTYEVNTTVFNYTDPDFESKLYELERITKSARDPVYKKAASSYKSLPEDLPESVFEFAQKITENAKTPLEKAFAIKKWLQKNCTYTLAPGEVPEGRDFVEYFLETKKGYCTYYASAMTVLARCADLPARYVTGFGIKQNPDRNSSFNYLATNETAHAWAEIYISGIGWVPFDATQFDFYELALVPEAEKPDKPEETPIETKPEAPSEEYVPSDPLPEIEDTPLSEKDPFKINWTWLYTAVLIAAVLITAVILRVRYIEVGPYRLHRRLKRHSKLNDEQLKEVYSLITDSLGYISIFVLPGETLSAFFERTGKLLDSERLAKSAFSILDKANYGMKYPSDEEIFTLCEFYVQIENKGKKQLSAREYFWRRVIFSYNPHKIKNK